MNAGAVKVNAVRDRAGQALISRFFPILVDQTRDLTPQIGGVIQAA
jgi:hypothetical protein